MKSPLRISAALIAAAQREGSIQKRSIPNQIEYWAELGKAVEHVLKLVDVYAVTQGLKKITVEPVVSESIDPEDVFNKLERSRDSLSKDVTAASVYYEASRNNPGLLDRVNSATGKRDTGRFVDGKFVEA